MVLAPCQNSVDYRHMGLFLDSQFYSTDLCLFLCHNKVKNQPTNAGDARETDSTPGLGPSPGEGDGNTLQYSCLENPMGRGAWWASVHGVTERWTQLGDTHTHITISWLQLLCSKFWSWELWVPLTLFVLRLIWLFLDPLLFHIDFRVSVSISTKKPTDTVLSL